MTRESHDSIADHYQQASLHLEAAAGHLLELERADQKPIVDYRIGIDASALRQLSVLAEQRAQAALQETKC